MRYDVQKLPTLTPTAAITATSTRQRGTQAATKVPTIAALVDAQDTAAATRTPTPDVDKTDKGDNEPDETGGAGSASITGTLTITAATGVTQTQNMSDTAIASTTVTTDTVLTSTPQISAADFVEPYTSTVQVTPPPTAQPTPTATPTPEPELAATCPISSSAHFDLIPIEGQAVRDHPDDVHGDLNLALRGYIPALDTLALVEYNGDTDSSAPRLHGLFEPNRQAQITAVYRVNNWEWDSSKCGGHPRGCPGQRYHESRD